MPSIIVSGSFDDVRSRQVRFLQEASQLGRVHALVWTDDVTQAWEGKPPKFPLVERLYTLHAIRYVDQISCLDQQTNPDRLPANQIRQAAAWVVDQASDNPLKRSFCEQYGLDYRIIDEQDLNGFPAFHPEIQFEKSPRKKVIVTGCYDWLHSGHIRFFEEVSGLGDLYVSLGSDITIRELKGERHPMLPQQERLYMVQAIRFVTCAFIATGSGYLDATPEIEALMPEIYAVNEDGDRPEKRAFCIEHGIEYVVLRRLPKAGLPARQSTLLRGY